MSDVRELVLALPEDELREYVLAQRWYGVNGIGQYNDDWFQSYLLFEDVVARQGGEADWASHGIS